MTWPIKPFGSLASFKNGLNFTRASSGAEVKILGVADFQENTRLTSVDNLTSVQLSGELREADLLQDGDLVFVRSNGNKALIGRCMLIQTSSETVSHSGFTIRARVITSDVLPEFLMHLMQIEDLAPIPFT